MSQSEREKAIASKLMALIDTNPISQPDEPSNENELLVQSTSTGSQWRYEIQPGQQSLTERLRATIEELEAEVQVWDEAGGCWRPFNAIGEGHLQPRLQIGEIPEAEIRPEQDVIAREAL